MSWKKVRRGGGMILLVQGVRTTALATTFDQTHQLYYHRITYTIRLCEVKPDELYDKVFRVWKESFEG
jgi:hypothetical protein